MRAIHVSVLVCVALWLAVLGAVGVAVSGQRWAWVAVAVGVALASDLRDALARRDSRRVRRRWS